MLYMSDLIHAHLAHLRAGGYAPKTVGDRAKILDRLDRDLPYGIEQVGTEDLDILCLLALPYADEPGYRDEWRPA